MAWLSEGGRDGANRPLCRGRVAAPIKPPARHAAASSISSGDRLCVRHRLPRRLVTRLAGTLRRSTLAPPLLDPCSLLLPCASSCSLNCPPLRLRLGEMPTAARPAPCGARLSRLHLALSARGLGAQPALGSPQRAAGGLQRTPVSCGSRRPAGGDAAPAGQPERTVQEMLQQVLNGQQELREGQQELREDLQRGQQQMREELQQMREEQNTLLGNVFDVAAAAVPEERWRRLYNTPVALAADCGLVEDVAAARRCLAETLLAEVWAGAGRGAVTLLRSRRHPGIGCCLVPWCCCLCHQVPEPHRSAHSLLAAPCSAARGSARIPQACRARCAGRAGEGARSRAGMCGAMACRGLIRPACPPAACCLLPARVRRAHCPPTILCRRLADRPVRLSCRPPLGGAGQLVCCGVQLALAAAAQVCG